MRRTIGSVVSGYIVMGITVFLIFLGAFFMLGTERVFAAGRYEPSTLWLALSCGVSLVAALAGGATAVLVGQSTAAPRALAAFVLVLGLSVAMSAMAMDPSTDPRPTVRPPEVAAGDAMRYARQPLWVMFVNPVLGAIGAIAGGTLARRR